MAQVLAPIVQTSPTITMLHSSPDAYQNPSATQPHPPRSSQMPRSSMYNAQGAAVGYRAVSAPIPPYAFSSTPQLRQEAKHVPSASSHSLPPTHPARTGKPSHTSSSSESTASTSGSSSRSMEPRKMAVDALSAATINLSTAVPDLTLTAVDTSAKPSPDRYRRGTRRTESSGAASSGTATPQASPLIGTTSSASPKLTNAMAAAPPTHPAATRPGHNRASSVDDMQVARPMGVEQAKRYRRRSLSGLDQNMQAAAAEPIAPLAAALVPPVKPSTPEFRPASSSSRQGSRPTSRQGHERAGSSGSASSIGSARPSSSRQNSDTPPAGSLRGASDAKRVIAPSPLSNPISPSEPPSPAVKQLHALNEKEASRGMKSRLRRAFSFGSAAELRRASAENNLSAERAKLRKDRYQNEQDAAQAAIVAKQEAAGIGAGIYSGQGGFNGSTDNLSISSAASSASIMLRKMGSGMKKGGRSIKGLFRPKSVIGVPAADGPIVQASAAQVSMVTAEAERQRVNVNADPREHSRGGTGYPKLERNSIDAERATAELNGLAAIALNEPSRKSIVGGDRERAEVLSSIKKGILKRTGTNSTASSPAARPADLSVTPKSSAPSTPNDEHTRPPPMQVPGDYFGNARHGNNSTRSLPNTPNMARSISFSPRIQFHDAWSSSEYDRRGDVATCNKLTPMLAQQIKEELNSFKMEMEVHELSKPHTHFF